MTDINAELAHIDAEWQRAKQIETQWQDYRRQLEDRAVHLLGLQQVAENMTTMSKEVKPPQLPHLKVKLQKERSFDQIEVVRTVTNFPYLINNGFKTEYKPMNRELTSVMQSENHPDLAAAVKATFTIKIARPGFSLR